MYRALPPAGVPITAGDLFAGLAAVRRGEAALVDFREAISRTFGVRHVFLASSGRAALSILLQAFHTLHPDRDVVALPAYTSFSVPSAVVNAGLNVSLYDVDPVTLSPVPESLARTVGNRTLAVVVCHLFGYLADLDSVRQITAPHGVPVIDDAAQAMGADFRGKPAGTCGDAGLYSLSRGKNINAVDGGIIVTDQDELARAVAKCTLVDPAEGTPKLFLKALLLSALLHPALYWFPRSLPFLNIGVSVFDPAFPIAQFTAFQAGIARRMLTRLPEITTGRRQVSARFLASLAGVPGILIPRPVPGVVPVHLRLPVIRTDSLPLREAPEWGVVRSYPSTLAAIPALSSHTVPASQRFPGAEFLAERLLTVPTHEFVTEQDCAVISRWFAAY